MEEEINKILRLILGIELAEDRKSTLQLALRQARKLGGVEAGKMASYTMFISRRIKPNSNVDEIVNNSFEAIQDEEMDVLTSLCMYLIALDQLGHIFGERNSGSNRVGVAIERSKNVLSPDCTNSLKDLRNSINHNFGLSCYNERKNVGKKKYTLVLVDDGENSPVEESKEIWLGNWCDKDERTSTHIYPFSLMNYAEKIINSFIKQFKDGTLKTPLCVEELKTRFTIITKNQ